MFELLTSKPLFSGEWELSGVGEYMRVGHCWSMLLLTEGTLQCILIYSSSSSLSSLTANDELGMCDRIFSVVGKANERTMPGCTKYSKCVTS